MHLELPPLDTPKRCRMGQRAGDRSRLRLLLLDRLRMLRVEAAARPRGISLPDGRYIGANERCLLLVDRTFTAIGMTVLEVREGGC